MTIHRPTSGARILNLKHPRSSMRMRMCRLTWKSKWVPVAFRRGQMVGVARGLRQAVAGDAGQREFDGGLEAHAVTDGDI